MKPESREKLGLTELQVHKWSWEQHQKNRAVTDSQQDMPLTTTKTEKKTSSFDQDDEAID
jgi:hypothetical protein